MTTVEIVSEVKNHAAHTAGTENWHKHWLGVLYTDGIKHLADTCGAYWLIDAVASHQPKIRKKEGREFQVWRLAQRGEGWRLDCWSDTPDKSTLLCKQDIKFSDFPEELAPFEFWCIDGTVLLKEEY